MEDIPTPDVIGNEPAAIMEALMKILPKELAESLMKKPDSEPADPNLNLRLHPWDNGFAGCGMTYRTDQAFRDSCNRHSTPADSEYDDMPNLILVHSEEPIPTSAQLKVIMQQRQGFTTENKREAKFHAILLARMKSAHEYPIEIELPSDCVDSQTEFYEFTKKYLHGVHNYTTLYGANPKEYSITVYDRVMTMDPAALEVMMKSMPKEMVEAMMKFPEIVAKE